MEGDQGPLTATLLASLNLFDDPYEQDVQAAARLLLDRFPEKRWVLGGVMASYVWWINEQAGQRIRAKYDRRGGFVWLD